MEIKNSAKDILVEVAATIVIYVATVIVLKTGKKLYRKFRPTTPPIAA